MNNNKIIIADDHRLFNDALFELLTPAYPSIIQVFDASSLQFSIQKEQPGLILLDINFQKSNGLDLAAEVKKNSPQIKIIIVTMYNVQRMVRRAKKLSLEGYILKDSSSEILLTGIHEVFSGRKYYDPQLSKIPELNDLSANPWRLTPREKQIIPELVKGKKVAEIASEIFLAYETVKVHRKNIYYKLKINSLTELIHFVNEHPLI